MATHRTLYQQTLDYLYEQLPMFSKYGKGAIKNDLSNITALCNQLGNPHRQFKTIHIAGTNGKGSTSHMIAAILQDAGYKTGLYTSPHLSDFRERIRINGQMIPEDWVTDFVDEHRKMIDEIEPSFFEVTVAMAFAAFAEEQVDIAVIETGLGGRLDSTNIITPLLSVITNISYDHQDILGHTLGEIAREKAGIIKQGVPVIIGEQHSETERVFLEHAVQKQCNTFYADARWALVRTGQDAQYQYMKAVKPASKEMYTLKTDLLGSYQTHNIKTALTAAEVLMTMGISITLEQAIDTLSRVKTLTGLRGRWEWLSESPVIIADVAHNAAGLSEVLGQWQQVTARQKHIIVGFVKDKDVPKALSYFPKDSIYHFCNASIPRALPAAELASMAAEAGLKGMHYPTVKEAVEKVVSVLQQDDALLITGSFFVVGEAVTPEIVS